MNQTSSYQKNDYSEEDDNEDAHIVEWSNLIFLPFQTGFKFVVLFSVLVKCALGPIQSVYPIVYCSDVMDLNVCLSFVKYFYLYCCDSIYGVDTLLHIVHRQVTEKAMRRKYLPKSAFFLLLDVISLIPFYRLVEDVICPPTNIWPNILAFTEFVIIYRIVEHFSLISTHSSWNIIIGFTLMLASCLNCFTCFWLLLTKYGLCENCSDNDIFDWRHYVMHKLNETNKNFTTYVYASAYVLSFAINRAFDETKPSTIWEFYIICILMICGYLLALFVVLPKLFAESILVLRRIFFYYPHIERIVQDTRRRNTSVTASVRVENFYKLMWKKRSGIIYLPEIMAELPRYLRLEICQDLVWPVFYHSPTLRKTSIPFKRWICDFIKLDYKLPGENFFTGPHCLTNLYYLKSGIVQLMSEDDGVTPILSVTGGTIFGDINFIIAPIKRKVIVRCLTYCEVFILSRHHLIKAMHKFPEDRKKILELAYSRIYHAKCLHFCKKDTKDLDRSESEGITWIKRRWWQLSDVISSWKTITSKKERSKFEIPPEEANYHCSKYIGQLVLCRDAQLQRKSMFANVDFPWIFVPNSNFGVMWRKLVIITVVLALILYPPYLTSNDIPKAFQFFQFWTDLIYIGDICVSLLTSINSQENVVETFPSVVFARCKSWHFFLDILSTIWIENILVVFGMPDLYYTAQFNRLIKIYILFTGELVRWDIRKNPMYKVGYKIMVTNFSTIYIMSYLFYMLTTRIPEMSFHYFFGKKHCGIDIPLAQCEKLPEGKFDVAISWTFERLFLEHLPHKLIDIYFGMISIYTSFMVYVFCKTLLIAAIYLQFNDIVSYKYFVTNLKKYYQYYNIHPDLLKRLDRYLNCHWKHYYGADVMKPDYLKNEPFDILWKVQGEVAEEMLSRSRGFAGANPALTRELAYHAKFLILPKNSTLVLFGVQARNAAWTIQGHVKCEYHSENGDLVKIDHKPEQLLSLSSVYLGKVALKTYIACTDCELLYIKLEDFHKILKRYPTEWTYFKNCIEEFTPKFEEIHQNYVKKYRDYQKVLRERIFHSRMSLAAPIKKTSLGQPFVLTPNIIEFIPIPDLRFLEIWMLFRAIVVFVSITAATLQGGSGATHRWTYVLICAFCDCIAWIDIILKLTFPYYNENGILIYDKTKCLKHYLTRGFLMDVIGAFPWYEVGRFFLKYNIDENNAMLINTACRFAHLYLISGYFDYIGDTPNINCAFIMIVKWQILMFLVMLGGSHFLMSFCVKFTFDVHNRYELIQMERKGICWMPAFFNLTKNITVDELNLIYVESLNLVQCGFTRMNFGKFIIDRVYIGIGTSILFLALLHWYVMCYSLALLFLNSRGNTLFQNGVRQLQRFLEAERVDKKLIYQAIRHFRYWWIRTKGVNIHHLTNERIGVVFRQDLSYYFFKSTFVALDTILQGGEALERQLASTSSQIYYLPKEQIVREMDLNSWVYVVHRGKVVISQNGKKLTTLTKGGIFGQFSGDVSRPIKISASSERHTDLLQISSKQFQNFITNKVRETIANNPHSKDDYLPTTKCYMDNPYETVQYLLRGRKAIKLPWMVKPMEARHNSHYVKWLYVAWIVSPTTSVASAMMLGTLPRGAILRHSWSLILSDIIHFINFVAEFYTMELKVVQNKCVKCKVGFGVLKKWGFYFDTLSLLVPFITLANDEWKYQYIRILRLRLFYDFHRNFCRSFKSKIAPSVLNITIVLLILHTLTCGWIQVACKGEFPLKIPLQPEINETIDYGEWTLPDTRDGGCARVTKDHSPGDYKMPGFVVPKDWHNDYVIALTYILLIHTHTTYDAVIALSLSQVAYKVVINFFIFLIDMWLMSVAISAAYTKFRDLYQYDYNVSNLITCLNQRGLSPTLLESVKEYTTQLWRRQRGNWLPELAGQAPMCLREDLMAALYMHHVTAPPIFRKLPSYFTRQLVARLQRVVIFPGKCIIQEGDIFSCIYFIHEGEVEKWYADKRGDRKMLSLLSVNGYFGLIPGLFPNEAFDFSYYSRTVVDLVFLKFNDWQDLLEGYPDIKEDLYDAAKQLKREVK